MRYIVYEYGKIKMNGKAYNCNDEADMQLFVSDIKTIIALLEIKERLAHNKIENIKFLLEDV